MKPELVVLAAGMGSRFGGLKQLARMGPKGESLLQYNLFDAERAGFAKAWFVIKQDFQQAFVEQVIEPYPGEMQLGVVLQDAADLPLHSPAQQPRSKPWGTGHALWAARKAVTAPFAVLNADDLYGPQALQALAGFLAQAQEGQFCLVAYALGQTLSPTGAVNRGLVQADQGKLVSIVEALGIHTQQGRLQDAQGRPLQPDQGVSMNCWGFTPAVFPLLEQEFMAFLARQPGPTEEFFLPTALDQGIRQCRIQVRLLTSSDPWIGVTYPEDQTEAARLLAGLTAQGIYPAPLWPG